MKKTEKVAAWMAVTVALWGGWAWGAVGVTNVTVQQRYPWNGLVDIDYEVVCDDPEADVYVMPQGFDGDLGQVVPMANLSGDGVNAPVKAGKHRMTWDMGIGNKDFHSSAFSVKFTAISGVHQYLVVDMSEGLGGAYSMSWLDAVPDGGWTDEYKTTKLVMRLIMPGTFTMGSPEAETGRGSDEIQHVVTLTKPYYIGVFEVTQKQWELVVGTTPANYKGDARPVERVRYGDIRGTGVGTNWPSNGKVNAGSFMGVLRAKTGLTFDLPTEAQWEYACRAGTTTMLNSGKNLTGTDKCANLAEVGRYTSNYSDAKGGYSQHTKVGSYLPNAWGLYDMHGNVWEFCLDWYGNYGTEEGMDPAGAGSGTFRVLRGGSWKESAKACRSARRDNQRPDTTYRECSSYTSSASTYDVGFRLVCSAGP